MTGIAPVHSPFLRQPLRQQCNLRLVDNRNCHHKAHQNYQFHAQDYNCIMLIIKIITMMIIHLKQTPIFGPTAFRSSWQWLEPRPLGPSWTSGCGSISGNDYDALLACKFSIMMVVGDSGDRNYGDKNDNFHRTMASSSPFEANTPGQSAWKDFCLRNISTFATFEAIWQAFDKLKWRRNHIWEKLFSAVGDNFHLCFGWGRPKLDQEKKLLDILLNMLDTLDILSFLKVKLFHRCTWAQQ